ncbi:MAG: spermidine synthase [Paracoccaceae bacterium]|jgi:spermidine synthase
MQHIFEELDYQKTPLGDISLRKRTEPRLDNILIYEVKLGDEFLMSSLFVEAEEQLATLGLQRLKLNHHQQGLNIVVGGLGLGYTALTTVQDKNVARLRTIDVMQPVISWHQQGLLPIGDELAVNPKSELIHGDFFAIATDDHLGVLEDDKVHAILLDIDHSPSHWLNQGNSGFYNQSSLLKMSLKIVTGGVFGLWSNERPDPEFTKLLNTVFSHTEEHVVSFPNPYSGGESINSVYISTV